MLAGKACAVFGFASTRSLAWGIAEAWSAAGASLTIGIQSERFRPALQAATAGWPAAPHTVVCDVANDADMEDAFGSIGATHGGLLHALAHSVAFAPSRAMRAPLLDTARDDFLAAHSVSAYSLLALSRGALPLFRAAGGGSVVALSYLGATRAARNYRVMGAAKASLEACARGLAVELAAHCVRVNVVSPGPVNTLAARGIEGFTVRGARVGGATNAKVYKLITPPHTPALAGAAGGNRCPRPAGARCDAAGGGRGGRVPSERRRGGNHRANPVRGRRLQLYCVTGASRGQELLCGRVPRG